MFQACFPKRIVHGRDSIRVLETLGASRVYCLVDEAFFHANAGLFAELTASLARAGSEHLVRFGEGKEPSLAFVKAEAAHMRTFGPDLVVAIGGGSVLDAAKVIQVYYEHPDITDAALYARWNLPPIRRKAGFVAVPTTSGSGSEVTPIAVLYVPSGDPAIPAVKRGIADVQLVPDCVVLDPSFTVTMPTSVTAATGLDAFVHAMEAFVSNTPKNPFADHFALEAMRKVTRTLPLVLTEPDNLEHRAEMQIAATMGGLALANRASGASHALGKQLATLCPVAHGMSVSILLPEVIRANAQVRLAEYAAIARYLGVDADGAQEALSGLVSVVADLARVAGCPHSLEDLRLNRRVFRDNLDLISRNALADAAMKGNPRVMSHDEVRAMFTDLASRSA